MTGPEQPTQAEIEAQALWEASGLPKPWNQRTRREHIEANVDDLITDFLYYDRKEDETLPVGAIEEAVKAGEITAEEIVARFASRLRAGLGGQV